MDKLPDAIKLYLLLCASPNLHTLLALSSTSSSFRRVFNFHEKEILIAAIHNLLPAEYPPLASRLLLTLATTPPPSSSFNTRLHFLTIAKTAPSLPSLDHVTNVAFLRHILITGTKALLFIREILTGVANKLMRDNPWTFSFILDSADTNEKKLASTHVIPALRHLIIARLSLYGEEASREEPPSGKELSWMKTTGSGFEVLCARREELFIKRACRWLDGYFEGVEWEGDEKEYFRFVDWARTNREVWRGIEERERECLEWDIEERLLGGAAEEEADGVEESIVDEKTVKKMKMSV